MSLKLTILFVPSDAVGHFNACIGLAEPLRDRGHKVVFATPTGWKGKLAPQGFIEKVYSIVGDGEQEASTDWGELASKLEKTFSKSSIEQIGDFQLSIFEEAFKRVKIIEPKLKEIVSQVKPHVIVIDLGCQQPALMDTDVPWILSFSISPLSISDKNVPPGFSGYPTNGDRTEWKKYRKLRDETFKDAVDDFKEWVIQNGGPKLNYPLPFFQKYSPYANIYMFPEELDYTSLRPNPPNFYGFDAFVRSSDNEVFELPEQLKNGPGKLVYFSMGTIGCSLLGVMRRLIGILAKSPHRFIVSKGPFADQLDLPPNMWGAPSVPQPKVIPLVDLVISHGGNNTVTEAFYFGKPLLVLPLFCDQVDNGQRVFETGLGFQFNPCNVTEVELLGAVDELLADDLLARRMYLISQRIQSSNSQSRAADVIEQVAKKEEMKRLRAAP